MALDHVKGLGQLRAGHAARGEVAVGAPQELVKVVGVLQTCQAHGTDQDRSGVVVGSERAAEPAW